MDEGHDQFISDQSKISLTSKNHFRHGPSTWIGDHRLFLTYPNAKDMAASLHQTQQHQAATIERTPSRQHAPSEASPLPPPHIASSLHQPQQTHTSMR